MASSIDSVSPQVRRSSSDDYLARREWIAQYFDRTAAAAWAQLTSDAPVGRVRASVRAGRDRMRSTLLSWLPMDLHGARVLDAGCGTGALSIELARRGADVVAIDLSPTLVDLAQKRLPPELAPRIAFLAGDMLDHTPGSFNYVVAMDSIIHYRMNDMISVLSRFMSFANEGVLFTVAPSSPLLRTMHAVGRLFPRGDRAPSIEPVDISTLRSHLGGVVREHWTVSRSARVAGGFYTSQAMELVNDRATLSKSEDLFT